MIMQFYSTTHFYPDGKMVWMTEGTRYQSSIAEWAKLINAPDEDANDIDVYPIPKKDHNSMENIYKEIPDKALETHKFGSILLSSLWLDHHQHDFEARFAAQVRRSYDDPWPFDQLSSLV